jgi:hypothetical protein
MNITIHELSSFFKTGDFSINRSSLQLAVPTEKTNPDLTSARQIKFIII